MGDIRADCPAHPGKGWYGNGQRANSWDNGACATVLSVSCANDSGAIGFELRQRWAGRFMGRMWSFLEEREAN